MAGAGYKLFNTGDVLTAAQVNTYLQEQTVMVFADATARTTALSGVLAEGMVTYLKDTNAIEKYTGAAWVNIDSGSTSPLTTKGDLYTYSTTDARLAVGNNGDTLVADSSATTGLRWQGNFAAGKNKIINGDFGIWQRGTSGTTATYGVYAAPDRFAFSSVGGTTTISRQAFTVGSAPVSGYESQYFCRVAPGASTTYTDFGQSIEDVRTFAGQTVTFSFWAKAASSVTFTPTLYQNFGSGGSSSVSTSGSNVTLTSSWTRYSVTVTLPSISGKTLGAGNNLAAYCISTSGTLVGNNIDIWGFQLEAGSVATAFQTATGTLAGELAACQRYYYRATGTQAYTCLSHLGSAETTSLIRFTLPVPAQMRVAPTAVDYSTLTSSRDGLNSGLTVSAVTLSGYIGKDAIQLYATITGATAYSPYYIYTNNSAAGYIGVSAEL